MLLSGDKLSGQFGFSRESTVDYSQGRLISAEAAGCLLRRQASPCDNAAMLVTPANILACLLTTMKRFRQAFILCALAALVFHPRLGETCGPFFNAAVFTREHGPDRPLKDFAGGKIGVVLPDWYDAYRIVAYRYLESKPLSAAEQQALLDHFDADRRIDPPEQFTRALADWTSARAQYAHEPAPNPPQEYRPSDYAFNAIPNCLAPAFITAVETLKDRASRFGPKSPEIEEWIRGQDGVFSNCGRGNNVPPELPAAANPLLRADRAYQIAAAHFYAGGAKDYEEALKDFQSIAADKASPWHDIAAYLVARTLIRQASATAEANKTYNLAVLAQAETQLEAILKDPELQSVHADAASLLGLVNYRLHPQQRFSELGKLLAEGGTGAHFGQDLVDYTWLAPGSASAAHDDLSDWLSAGSSPDGAMAKWRATRSMPWLVAVFWQLQPGDTAFAEVMAAAAKVPPTSEAYPTVAYYRARLARESGDAGLARQILKGALAQAANLPVSSLHLFQDEQMQVAADFDAFASHLWQNPIELDDEARDITPCLKSDSPGCGPQFSPAAATLLNTRTSAEVFARVALSPKLPAKLRRRMAPAAWARAALLDQQGVAIRVASAAGEAEPALKDYIQQYLQAKTHDERQFAAVFAILHFPGLRPYVDGPYPRLTAFQQIDNTRDNWWCGDVGGDVMEVNFAKQWRDNEKMPYAFLHPGTGASAVSVSTDGGPTGPKLPLVGYPAFFNAADKKRAAAEWRELFALGSASRYLPRVVLDWGKKHPDDPRVPEALYLAIRAMRYGSSNELSHDAFAMLHEKYPQSEWAKKSPFWYK
jgi:hypothetical protein